jgi:DNA-binding NarL/FixJ family response regulator
VAGSRILIISTYTLFVEAITHVLQGEGIEVAATARDFDAALPLIQAYRPDTIILDGDGLCPPDYHMADLLAQGNEDCQVIFFSLNSNRLVVHRQQQVGNATPADLLSLLGRQPGPLR